MKSFFLRTIQIFLGNICMTVAYSFIAIPNEIITGGITGTAMILSNITMIDISLFANAITTSLLILCLIFLGKTYFINSLVSSLFYMGLLNVFSSLNIQIDLGIFFNVLIGGALVGLGYKLCIDAEASTAGFDVVALIVNKYNKSISVGSTIRYISIAVMLIGMFQFGVMSVILGIGLVVVQTGLLNKLEDRKIMIYT